MSELSLAYPGGRDSKNLMDVCPLLYTNSTMWSLPPQPNTWIAHFWDLRDRRADGWFLMDSVWPTVAVSLAYYVFVRYVGPSFMKNRAPFELKSVMLVYNLAQTIINSWIFYRGVRLWSNYNFTCQPVDYSDSTIGIEALDMTYYYYLSKYPDLLDSIFFVLRKKFDHLSTLHVVHHGGLPLPVWFAARFAGGGHITFCGLLNAGVHVPMYVYYFLAALGPNMQPYLWWKRYLTKLQMMQFVVFFLHALQPLFIECDVPKAYCWLIICHGVLYFVLFANFYMQTYFFKKKDGMDKRNLKVRSDNHRKMG